MAARGEASDASTGPGWVVAMRLAPDEADPSSWPGATDPGSVRASSLSRVLRLCFRRDTGEVGSGSVNTEHSNGTDRVGSMRFGERALPSVSLACRLVWLGSGGAACAVFVG